MDYITHNYSLRRTLVARTLEGRGGRAEGEHSMYACYDLLSNLLYLILRHRIDYANQTKYLPWDLHRGIMVILTTRAARQHLSQPMSDLNFQSRQGLRTSLPRRDLSF